MNGAQEPSSVFAIGLKLNAVGSVQPKVISTQEPSSVFASEL